MIVKDEFLGRLRKIFDLNLYEVKVWAALLSRGTSTAGELSSISDVPRSRTYDILESLEKKGFIIMKLGKPIKFVALKPEEVVERVKKNLMRSAQEKTKRLENLKGDEVLDELTNLFTQGVKFVEPTDLSGALRGRPNLYTHLETMIKNAEKSVILVTTGKGLVRKIEALKPEFERLKKRGVDIKIAASKDKESVEAAKEVAKLADVRCLNDINARFAIIDGNDIMFMVMDDDKVHPSYDVGVWVKTPYFGQALQQMFDVVWSDLKPLK